MISFDVGKDTLNLLQFYRFSAVAYWYCNAPLLVLF